MPRVTGLRELRGGRIEVEVDGRPWRTLPTAAVVRAGVHVGVDLERSRLRELARARRQEAALATAARELARRDLTTHGLSARLQRLGVAPTAGAEAVAAVTAAGYVDDARFARNRAAALAARGYGDAAIRWQLERDGVEAEAASSACDELEPEQARAARIVARRGSTPATARFLVRRGFDEDVVATAVALES